MILQRKWKSQGFQAEAAGVREGSKGLCRDLEDGAGRKSLSCLSPQAQSGEQTKSDQEKCSGDRANLEAGPLCLGHLT